MEKEPSPALVLGRLADEQRLRMLSAVALGATSVSTAAARAGVSENEAARALAHLVGAGMIVQGESGLEVDLGVFARAARAAAVPRKRPDMSDASPGQAAVLRNFVDADGRITALPAREAKRRLVLEYVAGRFEPGREYPEREVNGLLLAVHDDVASMRRYLVDAALLEREAGVYRRVEPVADA
jgi:hypothetical protein